MAMALAWAGLIVCTAFTKIRHVGGSHIYDSYDTPISTMHTARHQILLQFTALYKGSSRAVYTLP